MSSLGRKRLIAKLEGMIWQEIYNNDSQIRYPITFDGNRQLRGRYNLKVTEENERFFFSGRYVFGANELYVYRAINRILEYLMDSADLVTDDLEYDLEEEGES